MTIQQKIGLLKESLRDRDVLVAFSGGVDSSVLAAIAKESANRVVLLTVDSQVIPRVEIAEAKRVAGELDSVHKTVRFDWLANERLTENSRERCYRCKAEMATLWKTFAEGLGMDTVIEGTTASDLQGHRPGMDALRERGIVSPLLDAMITKSEVREIARNYGLSVADKPSMACLATRFPYGVRITREKLEMVEEVEENVRRALGVKTIRARHHGEIVRIEVGEDDLKSLTDRKRMKTLLQIGKRAGFTRVALDLEGYHTGSMDELGNS